MEVEATARLQAAQQEAEVAQRTAAEREQEAATAHERERAASDAAAVSVS